MSECTCAVKAIIPATTIAGSIWVTKFNASMIPQLMDIVAVRMCAKCVALWETDIFYAHISEGNPRDAVVTHYFSVK